MLRRWRGAGRAGRAGGLRFVRVARCPAGCHVSPAAAGGGPRGGAAPFVSIVEPFDPGHPARTETAPASCGGQGTTLAIEKCYETMTENVDAQIDAAQSAKYASATAAGRAAILTQDSAWLAARGPVCDAAFNTGGTDRRDQRRGLPARREQRPARRGEGITPHESRLKATDSMDPNALAWYTTPEGSRIAELSTQGDQTGGAVVTWIIIGGAQGFVVNPKQFFYMDSPFTDPGVLEPRTPPTTAWRPARSTSSPSTTPSWPRTRTGSGGLRLRARRPGGGWN